MPGQIFIITGMSGAGKSQVVKTLEDHGFFCVDNLPPNLFAKFIEGMRLAHKQLPQMAIVADVRTGIDSIPEIEQVIIDLRSDGDDLKVLFLEASDNVLLSRFKENRRPHPLSEEGMSTLELVKRERQLMEGLRGVADIIIDTSEFTNQQLAAHLEAILGYQDKIGITVSISSFGFKYGLPIDADLVMDVRFLPNPFYIQELRSMSGINQPVADYVLQNPVTKDFLRIYLRLLRYLLPHYHQEGKKHISIAIGCTGGRHRSVAMVEYIGKKLAGSGYSTSISHRDINRKKELV